MKSSHRKAEDPKEHSDDDMTRKETEKNMKRELANVIERFENSYWI